MSAKSDRQAAREAVAGYHESKLTGLVQHVGDAIDRFRGGELDAFDIDQAIFQYSRAANSGRDGSLLRDQRASQPLSLTRVARRSDDPSGVLTIRPA